MVDIFGVSLENLTREAVLRKASLAMEQQRPLRIATVNPEYLLLARNNERFRQSLQKADLRVVDGFGVQLVAWLLGHRLTRYAGADLLLDLLRLANDKQLPVYLVLNKYGLSSLQETKAALLLKYPKLPVAGQESDPASFRDFRFLIPDSSLVLCNYGAPEQEWLLDDIPGRHIAMGVGGSFDYLTGKLARAPKWMRRAGVEWLWRLGLQPRRIGRIWNAVIVFPFMSLFRQ